MTWNVGDVVWYRYARDLVRCEVIAELDWKLPSKYYRIKLCDESWSGIAPAHRLYLENEPAPPGAQLSIF